MRGLMGNRLLKRFTGHNWHSPELQDVPESASDDIDGETADLSNKRSLYTPPEHSDSAVHETKAETEVAKQRERP